MLLFFLNCNHSRFHIKLQSILVQFISIIVIALMINICISIFVAAIAKKQSNTFVYIGQQEIIYNNLCHSSVHDLIKKKVREVLSMNSPIQYCWIVCGGIVLPNVVGDQTRLLKHIYQTGIWNESNTKKCICVIYVVRGSSHLKVISSVCFFMLPDLINIHVPYKFNSFSSLLPATVSATTPSPTITTNMPDTNRTDKITDGKTFNVIFSLIGYIILSFEHICIIYECQILFHQNKKACLKRIVVK